MVRVRVLDGMERLRSWLQRRDDIADVLVEGNLAVFKHSGGPESEADLLREMVDANFLVVEFGAKHSSLEDVFLHVTEGRVQ
jgi:ABC-2 type transport system ATP-binding protein